MKMRIVMLLKCLLVVFVHGLQLVSAIRREAESFDEQHGCIFVEKYGVVEGDGFMKCPNPQSWIKWNNIPIEKDDNYQILVRYSVLSVGRPCELFIQDKFIGELEFKNTTGWDQWHFESIEVFLEAGPVNVSLVPKKDRGPRLDFIIVQPVLPELESVPFNQPVPTHPPFTLGNSDTSNFLMIEAEDCSRHDIDLESKHPGFSGDAYLDFQGPGSYFESKVSIANEGDHLFTFHYAAGDVQGRPCEISLDGKVVGKIHFNSTKGWKTWNFDSIRLFMKSGVITVRVTSVTDGPNVDFFLVESAPENSLSPTNLHQELNIGRPIVGIHEAEDFSQAQNCTEELHYGLYTGRGYMHCGGDSPFIQWDDLLVEDPGNYTFGFRYAVSDENGRSCEFFINDVAIGTLPFSDTGGWDSWIYGTITVELEPGTINARLVPSDSSPSLDYLMIRKKVKSQTQHSPFCKGKHEAESAEVAPLVLLENKNTGYFGSGYATFSQLGGWLKWNITVEEEGEHEISIRYSLGDDKRKKESTDAILPEENMAMLHVGDLDAGRIALEETGGSSEWDIVSITAQLSKGQNTIKLTPLGQGAKVDFLHLQRKEQETSPGLVRKRAKNLLLCMGFHEAECCSKSQKTHEEDLMPGYTGDGYVNIEEEGSIQWSDITVDKEGEYLVSFRYFTGGSKELPCHLTVGEKKIAEIIFEPTGELANWSHASFTAPLKQGTHTMKLTSKAAGLSVDYLVVEKMDHLGSDPITYSPGCLTERDNGLKLSTGLKSKMIAESGRRVRLKNGEKSKDRFHVLPDGAGVFLHENGSKWAYVSNSENRTVGAAGVGSLIFDEDGEVIDYKRLLKGTRTNCGGGATPWNTWLSCEEHGSGQVWEVDPFGEDIFDGESSQLTKLASGNGAAYESVACDNRDPENPVFYYTIDSYRGELTRFKPNSTLVKEAMTTGDYSRILSSPGERSFLVLEPNFAKTGGMFHWTNDREEGKESAKNNFRYCEGIAFDEKAAELSFDCKGEIILITLNIEDKTYEKKQLADVFRGHPDQMTVMCIGGYGEGMLFFAEDGGDQGIHARDMQGNYFTIIEGVGSEASGIAFSPNNKHMYFASQTSGIIWDIVREDGLAFNETAIWDPLCTIGSDQ